MFMLLECISLGWEKHPCPKEKRDSNQTNLPLPYKKYRHTPESLMILVLLLNRFEDFHLENQLYAIRTLLGWCDCKAIKCSPSACLSLQTHTYTYTCSHTNVHTQSHLCLLPIQWTPGTLKTAVFHGGIKQGWLSQDLLFLLSNALPLVQGGETNGLDLEGAENSL